MHVGKYILYLLNKYSSCSKKTIVKQLIVTGTANSTMIEWSSYRCSWRYKDIIPNLADVFTRDATIHHYAFVLKMNNE